MYLLVDLTKLRCEAPLLDEMPGFDKSGIIATLELQQIRWRYEPSDFPIYISVRDVDIDLNPYKEFLHRYIRSHPVLWIFFLRTELIDAELSVTKPR